MVEKRYYSPAEVGATLAVSTSTVLRLIHEGKLGALRVSDRIYRIPAPALERFQAGPSLPAIPITERRVKSIAPLGSGEGRPRSRRMAASSR